MFHPTLKIKIYQEDLVSGRKASVKSAVIRWCRTRKRYGPSMR